MIFNYIYTTIITVPLGYHTRVVVPVSRIQDRVSLKITSYEIEAKFIVFRNGEIIFEKTELINKASLGILDFEIRDQDGISEDSAYAELSFVEKNQSPIFESRAVINFYTTYFHENKKSFLSDNAYKFGSPTIINQMAEIKKYIDAYPTLEMDKDKDLGETIVLINPYKRKVKANIFTADCRNIENIIVNPFSVREVPLDVLLMNDEKKWSGHMQLVATNRLVTFNFKHSLKNKKIISDYEHLDPFRGEPTYMPYTQYLRNKFGYYFSKLFKN